MMSLNQISRALVVLLLTTGCLMTLSACVLEPVGEDLASVKTFRLKRGDMGNIEFGKAKVSQAMGTLQLPFRIDPGEGGRTFNVHRIDQKVKKDRILINITARSRSGDQGKIWSSVMLSGIPAGEYRVVYVDPDRSRHELGKVEIPYVRPAKPKKPSVFDN